MDEKNILMIIKGAFLDLVIQSVERLACIYGIKDHSFFTGDTGDKVQFIIL